MLSKFNWNWTHNPKEMSSLDVNKMSSYMFQIYKGKIKVNFITISKVDDVQKPKVKTTGDTSILNSYIQTNILTKCQYLTPFDVVWVSIESLYRRENQDHVMTYTDTP